MDKDEMVIIELYRSDNKKLYEVLKFSEDDFMDFINLVEMISKIFKKKKLFNLTKKKNAESRINKLIDLAHRTKKVKIKILVDADEC